MVAVVLAEIADGGIDAKALAMLGVLSAINAALRPLGAGTAGIETVFFLLVLAGRVFGPGFGFALGCTSLFASALLTGGVGPWLPYQMFGCAWVGLVRRPAARRARGRREIALLAAYGAVAGYVFGFMLEPVVLAVRARRRHRDLVRARRRRRSSNLHRYLVFDATTSLGWDTGRAVTNVVLHPRRRSPGPGRPAAFVAPCPVRRAGDVRPDRPAVAPPQVAASSSVASQGGPQRVGWSAEGEYP